MVKKLSQTGLAAQAGVTLIEMLVVVAIIAVVSSVMMFNYSDFSTNVSVRTLSQEVALSIRKAQTYATSVRSVDGTNIQDSSAYAGYGISFSTNDTATDPYLPTSKQFVLFVDIPGSDSDTPGTYGSQMATCGTPTSSGNECVEAFGISTADKVVAICGGDATYVSNPSDPTAPCNSKGSVDISFKRPSPDAKITYTSASGVSVQSAYAQIILESAKGVRRGITVWNTGQIGVQ